MSYSGTLHLPLMAECIQSLPNLDSCSYLNQLKSIFASQFNNISLFRVNSSSNGEQYTAFTTLSVISLLSLLSLPCIAINPLLDLKSEKAKTNSIWAMMWYTKCGRHLHSLDDHQKHGFSDVFPGLGFLQIIWQIWALLIPKQNVHWPSPSDVFPGGKSFEIAEICKTAQSENWYDIIFRPVRNHCLWRRSLSSRVETSLCRDFKWCQPISTCYWSSVKGQLQEVRYKPWYGNP